jgi:hypothetical protein
VTTNVPSLLDVHDRMAVCGDEPNVTLGGNVQMRPVGFEGETDRVTSPVNPFRPVTVMVWVTELPVSPLRLTGEEGSMVKSTMWKSIADVECERLPSVPVTVTV